jgi:hypothetical protein
MKQIKALSCAGGLYTVNIDDIKSSIQRTSKVYIDKNMEITFDKRKGFFEIGVLVNANFIINFYNKAEKIS